MITLLAHLALSDVAIALLIFALGAGSGFAAASLRALKSK